MSAEIHGILPVLPTPFDAKGAIDAVAMPKLVEFAISAGVAGVVFPGFASEVEHLSEQERETLLAKVAETAQGRVHVVAGASAPTPEKVISHGKIAEKLGITVLMIQPPIGIGNTADAVITFFRAVTQALPQAQIILQNAPAPRGSDLSGDTLLEIVRALPQITYIKEETLPSGPTITQIMDRKPAHLNGIIGGGGARYILDEYQRGACAAMPALEIADLHVKLDQAWRAGDLATARKLYVMSLPLLTLQAVFRMRLTKYTMKRRGILDHIGVRAPTADLDSHSRTDIDQNLAELGVIPA